MKAITWSFLFIFSLSAQAAALKINLKPVGWDYQYYDSKVRNMHVIYDKKDTKTKAIVARKLSVLRPDEKLGTKKFLNRKCPNLSDKMNIELDIESNLCIQELEIKGKKNTTYFFVTMRKSKMKKSFYWNSVSFLNTKKEDVNKNLIKRIRAELEKNNI